MLALILTAAAAASTPVPPGLAAYIRDRKLTRYDHALSDLNGDGRPEALVYAWRGRDGNEDSNVCGSGGCDLTILSLTPTGYRVISTISITRPPIRILPGMSNGWHDLSVLVAGGGIQPGYRARLRFDGKTYPTNPSVAPALPIEGTDHGTTAIAAQTR